MQPLTLKLKSFVPKDSTRNAEDAEVAARGGHRRNHSLLANPAESTVSAAGDVHLGGSVAQQPSSARSRRTLGARGEEGGPAALVHRGK